MWGTEPSKKAGYFEERSDGRGAAFVRLVGAVRQVKQAERAVMPPENRRRAAAKTDDALQRPRFVP